MKQGFNGVTLRQFTRLFQAGTLSAASDRELLAEFSTRRDDAAFEMLLKRHGRLALNVCRKLLHDPQDVEDAFQATFLVLVRKTPHLRVGESLSPWISTVAYRVAARVRARRIRLNRIEQPGELEAASAPSDSGRADVSLMLHEEVNRLPDRLRRPVVCCYLEGMTHERAAESLGCPVGTVRSRLARARTLLHRRLSVRGVSPSVVPIEALLASSRWLDLPPRLIHQTLRLAVASSVSASEAGVASASLLALVNGVVWMMNLKKALVLCAAILPVGGVLAVGAAQGYQQAGGERDDVASEKISRPMERQEEPRSPKASTYVATYYVGDILGEIRRDSVPAGAFDYKPLREIILNSVAPGTWEKQTEEGVTIWKNDPESAADADRRVGTVTPFFMSSSLIVRQTPEVHERLSYLLGNLRAMANANTASAFRSGEQYAAAAAAAAPITPERNSPSSLEPLPRANAPDPAATTSEREAARQAPPRASVPDPGYSMLEPLPRANAPQPAVSTSEREAALQVPARASVRNHHTLLDHPLPNDSQPTVSTSEREAALQALPEAGVLQAHPPLDLPAESSTSHNGRESGVGERLKRRVTEETERSQNTRVRQLLSELQRELDAMESDSATKAVPAKDD